MRDMVRWARQESVSIQAGVQAFIALGVAFGWWHWTPMQTGAVVVVVASFLGLVVRSQVTPLTNPHSSNGEPLFTKAAAEVQARKDLVEEKVQRATDLAEEEVQLAKRLQAVEVQRKKDLEAVEVQRKFLEGVEDDIEPDDAAPDSLGESN